jgi:hypothetical protein
MKEIKEEGTKRILMEFLGKHQFEYWIREQKGNQDSLMN